MFWRMASFAQSSPIEGILDKDSFTLADLLAEDDIVQVGCHCRSSSMYANVAA